MALLWAGDKPDGALQFKEGGWGCVMWLFANAARGRTAVADRKTFGCLGGGTGLGFGNQYLNWQGGVDAFCRFLSTGSAQLGATREDVDSFREGFVDNVLHGERYIKLPELVKRFLEVMPFTDIPKKHVVFKPLEHVQQHEEAPVASFSCPTRTSLPRWWSWRITRGRVRKASPSLSAPGASPSASSLTGRQIQKIPAR